VKIAYIITKYAPKGGIFNSVDRIRNFLVQKNINVDVFVRGRNNQEKKYIFFNKRTNLEKLLSYDIVELYQCWGKETISDEFLNILKELVKKNKLVFRIHDVKAIQSKSKTNYSDIIRELENAVFIFHGKEEERYCALKYNLKKTIVIGHWIEKPTELINIKEKYKIIVPSRIDFCKGLEFIKKFIEESNYNRKIEFYSQNINEKFVYFTNFNTILNSELYHKNIGKYLDIYKLAKCLLNFTWWGEGSGGRPELTVLEGWQYGTVPFLDSRWVNGEGILKNNYNCISIQRNNINELKEKLDNLFSDFDFFEHLVNNGYKSLSLLNQEKYKLVDFYKNFTGRIFSNSKKINTLI
jgi:hypothetical protein